MRNTIFTFKRQLLLTILLGVGVMLYAQEKTIHVEVSGDVESLLTSTEKANTVKLIVTTANGVILNEDDFTVMNSMSKLKELDLSGDLNTTYFPKNAFMNNATIEKIAFPANTAIFDASAFNNCALKGIVSFPKSVTNENVFISRFDNCQGVTGFAFPDNGPDHVMQATEGGVIIAYGTNLMKYPCGKTDDTYTIPDGITYIAQQAFGDNHRLKKIIFPASVSVFHNENATFRNSTTLEEIEVDESNTTYGSTANGFLFNKVTKTLFFLPPANKDEEIYVDGTFIRNIGSNYFSNSPHVKSVVFGEGVEDIGYSCFKQGQNGPLQLEYVELPSTVKKIQGEAFANCENIIQIISKALVPPLLEGNAIFRGANNENTVKVGVPEAVIADYVASSWNDANYSSWIKDGDVMIETGNKGNGFGFKPSQIVAYKNISYENASGTQDVSIPGFQVKVKANEASGGLAFSGWASDPEGVVFLNANAATTYFTMPQTDVTIKAIFSEASDYTIIGATVSKSGTAGVGSIVSLETAGCRIVEGNTLYFLGWRVNKGDVTIANPELAATSFIMIDGEIEIEALYGTAYMININGGSAMLEAFEGDVVTITASRRPNMEFDGWTSTTPGVEFANASAEVTTFVMPAREVDIKANFREIERIPYTITIDGGTAIQEAKEDDVVTITASEQPDMEFDGWTSTTPGVKFADASAEVTTFVMPAREVNIKANFREITSLNDIKDNSLQLYPNPATDYIQLSHARNTEYTIYNVSGKAVKHGITNGEKITLDTLSKGIYIFNAEGKSAQFIKK